jgi:hypothetical protein
MAESPGEISKETKPLGDPSTDTAASAPNTEMSPGRIVTEAKQRVKDAAVGIPVAVVAVAAVVIAIGTLVPWRNRREGEYDRPRTKQLTHRMSSSGVGLNRTRLLAGACVGLGCWSAWCVGRLAREGTLISDLAQPM